MEVIDKVRETENNYDNKRMNDINESKENVIISDKESCKKEKTYVEDIDRSLYDFKIKDMDVYQVNEGLNKEIVEEISKEKNDPDWMKTLRLKSLDIYNNMEMSNWGPPIDGLNMENIVTYIRPKDVKMSADWEDVPEDIK